MERLPVHIEMITPDRAIELSTEDMPFVSVAVISKLRSQQYSLRTYNRLKLLETNLDADLDIADADTFSMLDDFVGDYLKQYVNELDPSYQDHFDMIRSVSIDNMNHDSFEKGDLLPDGTYDEENSGWRKTYDYHRALVEIPTANHIDAEPTADDEDQPPTDPTDDDTDPEDPDLLTPNPFTEIIQNLSVEYADLQAALKPIREARARAEVEFGSRRWFSGHKRRKALVELSDAYNAANVEAAKKYFELKKTEAEEIGLPLESEELNRLAQIYFGEEYAEYAKLQSEASYLTDFGKKCRHLGSLPLKNKLWRMARNTGSVVGLGVLGVATGGLAGAAAFGIAAGIRVVQTRNTGMIGHRNDEKTAKTTQKAIKKTVAKTDETIMANKSVETDDLAKLVAESTSGVLDRIHQSNKNRRRILGATMGAAALVGFAKAYSSWQNGSDIFSHIHPKHPRAVSGIDKAAKPSSDYVAPIKPPATPPNIPDAQKPLQQLKDLGMDSGGRNTADYATYYENQRNFYSILGTPGEHPWNRAVGVFGGDTDTASDWLRTAATKAGAHWHGSGANAYIQLANGETDTDSVWNALVVAMNS
jgi:hypothetical protein